jgi:predicted kinase
MPETFATAFLIHGYIGAGKTTLARRLEKDEHAVRFTHDEWMVALYGSDPPETQFAEYAQRVSTVMETMWTRCIGVRTSVVLDFGFWSREERDRVRRLVSALGGTPLLYHVLCSDDVAWRRVEKRNERSAGNLYIAPNTFHLLRSRFEPLEPDEARITIRE